MSFEKNEFATDTSSSSIHPQLLLGSRNNDHHRACPLCRLLGDSRVEVLPAGTKKTFISEFSLKLDPPQSSLRPWHGHRRRSVSIGTVARDLTPDCGGCDDGHALAGVKLWGLLKFENSVKNIVFQ